jgi:hypothetical protein
MQSVWVSVRGVKKEFDEAKLRFAAAEVCRINLPHFYCLLVNNPDVTQLLILTLILVLFLLRSSTMGQPLMTVKEY